MAEELSDFEDLLGGGGSPLGGGGDNATARLEELKVALEHFQSNTDVFFLITMGTIVFFLQAGFAFLEAGAVRSKNTTNILIKNMLDVFIGGISYWLVGYALAFGEGNMFCGTVYWASVGVPDERLAFWFFQFVFAATCATIVSGSMAERCAFSAYFIYSIILTAFVYPIVTHWAWTAEGWLSVRGYQDFAGSGVVHLTGGVAALVGAIILGPRIGRFGPNGREIRGHSVPLAALGGFILLFGFLAFNGGSQASISQEGDAAAVAKSVVNTVISGCSAGIVVLLLYRSGLCGRTHAWSFLMALNGALCGMVSICSGCNVMRPWAACVTGVIAGPIFLAFHKLLPKLRVDDPLDAVAVHMGGGLWGLVAVALFQDGGIVFGGTPMILAWNMVGALAIIGWSGGICVIMFGIMRLSGLLRVPPELEMQGMDIVKHGEPAYPAKSWEEHQYGDNQSHSGRNKYLPPNMSSPWYQGWMGGAMPSYAPYAPYWTLPGPHRGGQYPPAQDPSTLPRPNGRRVSEFAVSDVNQHYEMETKGYPHRGKRSSGYYNDGFEEEHSKM
ncbi:putative ammonium transporter 1 [Penaeus indicus]|uniref:putative ammonium transporter 1 n=1 Tax=Penaeus indicus TaxID=29960 RepID=UPI00300C4DBB